MRMLHCASILLAVSTVAAQGQSDQGAVPEFRAKSAYGEFTRTHEGPWVVDWNWPTLTPRAIYGQGLPIAGWTNSLESARVHANRVLREHADVLGLGTSEFRESIGARMGRSWSFKFDQFFRGLPVIGGRADVRINMAGRVAMMGSTAAPVPATFDTTPQIGEETAVAIAWRKSGEEPTGVAQPGAPRAPRLVIWGDVDGEGAYALAWEVFISNVAKDGSGPIGRHYIDARTGALLKYVSDKHDCGFTSCTNPVHLPVASPAPLAAPVATTVTLMAWTRTAIDGQAALVNVPLRGVIVTVPGIGTRTTDANGQFSIDIAAPVNITIGALDGTHHAVMIGGNAPSSVTTVNPGVATTIQLLTAAATTNEAAHTTTTYWVDATNEWIRSILDMNNGTVLGAMNTISGILPTVNIGSTCNAYYTNNTINFYQAGGGCANTAFSTVISHEWGHGLDDRFGGISNASGDGLSEGWGDIIGMYLVDSPNLGSGFQTAGVALRSGNNTKLYGSQTEVHAAGEIWMGFAWKYRENLRTAFGTPQAIAISEDTVIASIVADAANQADAVTQVFIADDNDGNLANGTPHYAQLSAAAIAKGMPYPPLQVASVTHTPLGNTTNRLTPRIVDATAAVVSSGSITQVRLVYSANGGATQNRVMVPNGAVNGYRGLLPGVASGLVTYHIEATHSGGAVVRTPASGEISYTVSAPASGPFTAFYSENFTAGTGWTTTRVSGVSTNDWQRGAPNGKTGTSSGVAWQDPSAAVSNGSIYGTDLGAGTSNGAYPNSMNYYLLSPVINCTGRTGVKLRFRRWLQVEEGQYDQATISVNGVTVWANPQVGNFQDTAWTTVEYELPMADNNPAVQIMFRLVTDGGLVMGGWNIDDVEVGTQPVAPLDATLTMTPEQAAGNANVTINVTTQGAPKLFYLAIGDNAGPTIFAGVPPILVGSIFAAFPAFTDATGNYTTSFPAPTPPSALGLLWYSQVLTLDATNTNIVTSNQWLNLFTL